MKMDAGERALDKIYKRRDRYDIPEWQREEVWDRAKKQELIDTILRGWTLPKFYFLKTSNEPEEYEVVDGQQRLSAILEFFDNELPLSDDAASRFGGRYYKELPSGRSDEFDDFEIQFDVITDATDEEIKDFFQRLQAGLPLTSSEKLNAIHSNLRDFVRTLAGHGFFKNKVAIGDKRYAHFDIVSKVAAIEIEGLSASLRFDEVKKTFERQAKFSPESNVGRRLTQTFDYLDRVFPNRTSVLRNRTVVQSFATLTCRIVATGRADGKEDALRGFFDAFMAELSAEVEKGQEASDADYITFQRTVSANLSSGPETRQQILLRKLFAYDPTFATLFDPADVAGLGLHDALDAAGRRVAELVFKVNQAHAAQTGEDLIKPTTKVMEALTSLGKPIASFEDYKNLADRLYFVFREGPGGRLNGAVLESFEDVNDLRTAVQHDLDHGKPAKAATRRRDVGSTFQKYAGAPTPETLAPELFPVVQMNILSALERDLKSLL